MKKRTIRDLRDAIRDAKHIKAPRSLLQFLDGLVEIDEYHRKHYKKEKTDE